MTRQQEKVVLQRLNTLKTQKMDALRKRFFAGRGTSRDFFLNSSR